uniref:SMP-30/Gluconolactonase/LRE-like region domain-containing protein n=1 Tax=Branchiostoma floridae TaxID=7739 RepID=C3YUS6_BRAFL|eukprot:XP_002599965.1 hypothetical protein BRAFLDRAFT_74088 [Branchiostoma floridae]
MNEDPISDATVLVTAGGMAQANPVTTTGKTASRPAGIGGIKPYAVRYQTDDHDDDDMVTKSKETRNVHKHKMPVVALLTTSNRMLSDMVKMVTFQRRETHPRVHKRKMPALPMSTLNRMLSDMVKMMVFQRRETHPRVHKRKMPALPMSTLNRMLSDMVKMMVFQRRETQPRVNTSKMSALPMSALHRMLLDVGKIMVFQRRETQPRVNTSKMSALPMATLNRMLLDVGKRTTFQQRETQPRVHKHKMPVLPMSTSNRMLLDMGKMMSCQRKETQPRVHRVCVTIEIRHRCQTVPNRTFVVTTANGYLRETTPTLSPILITSLAPNGEDEKPEKIVFGGLGTEPGKFQQACRVAVSDDNEIFVPDFYNRRIQVHNMSGVYLRLFPTVVPGKKVKMQPNGVAIDGEGHLWVAGVREEEVHVVQYRRHGQPLSKFDVTGVLVYPEIAVDVDNHKIIVTNKNEILVFQPNGSLHLRFRETQRSLISSVTTDSKGNILVTVIPNSIQVYNRHGVRLFTAGTCRRGQFPCHSRGICLDTLGRIVVANGLPGRVDMYTSRGKFVRTLVNIEDPWGIAIGRDGQLLVTSKQEGTVTIFPRQVVYNTGN